MSAIDEFVRVEDGEGDGFGRGYGSGCGSGNGCGDSYGSGSYYGTGFGYGNGSGSGYSCGDGYGFGDGFGDGIGYGRANGEGYGYCYGDDDGIKSYCGRTVYNIDDIQTLLYHVHGNVAKGAILKTDLTLEPCYVVKSGNLYAHGETLREAQEALQEKLFDDMPVEERIQAFLAEFKPGIEYPAKEFYDWHHRLTGSCEMGRKSFAKEHGIDIEHDMMTVEKFIQLTKNAYGGNVIKEIIGRLRE